tara:strand:- start:494 stop:1267 length:774 start_codon:yes stop_codon:yes gene_type:complete
MSEDFAKFIEYLCKESGRLIRSFFGAEDIGLEHKEDATPVTRADREAEALIRAQIEGHFPDHGIIGEEYGSDREDADYVWILDPIDGTQSFVHGVPLFGTLIGLLHEGKPIYGAINQPILGELCLGTPEGTLLNGNPVRVRNTEDWARATMLFTDAVPPSYKKATWKVKMHEAFQGAGIVRTWGDCYGYLMVASGRADVMVDPIMNPWDLLPLIPVIRGAGGIITDLDGNEAEAGSSAVAAVPALHTQVLERLQKAR